MKYPRFIQELQAMGTTDSARSEVLDVSTKTIERYRAGEFPDLLVKLFRHPQLLRALADDVEQTLDKEDNIVLIGS